MSDDKKQVEPAKRDAPQQGGYDGGPARYQEGKEQSPVPRQADELYEPSRHNPDIEPTTGEGY
ncbi:MAG: hypothetical protein ACK4N5_05970 [Myxococcales bacterium]